MEFDLPRRQARHSPAGCARGSRACSSDAERSRFQGLRQAEMRRAGQRPFRHYNRPSDARPTGPVSPELETELGQQLIQRVPRGQLTFKGKILAAHLEGQIEGTAGPSWELRAGKVGNDMLATILGVRLTEARNRSPARCSGGDRSAPGPHLASQRGDFARSQGRESGRPSQAAVLSARVTSDLHQ